MPEDFSWERQGSLRTVKTPGERRLRSPLQGLLRLRTPEMFFRHSACPAFPNKYFIRHTSLKRIGDIEIINKSHNIERVYSFL